MRRRLAASLLACGALACGTAGLERDAWIEISTHHFRIVSNETEERAVSTAHALELMRAVFARTTSARRFDSTVPTHIYLFRNRPSANRFGLGFQILGYFTTRLTGNYVAVLSGANPFETIGHEYVHFLLRNQASRRYPSWYHEGLAETLSTVVIARDGIHVGATAHLHLAALRKSPRLVDPERLFAARNPRDPELEEWESELFYPQSWLATHYFFFGAKAGFPDRREQVRRYLALQNRGRDVGEALREAFGAEPAVLQGELAEYLERETLPHRSLPVESLRMGRVLGVAPLATDQALARIGFLRLHVFDLPDGFTRRLFWNAIRADARNARAVAGYALTQQDPRRAEDEFERALALAPDDALIHALYADWLREGVWRRRSALSVAQRERLLAPAREHFARSLELDPELPLAHAGLGAVQLAEGADFAAGIAPLERARELLPGSLEIALWLGELHLRAGHPAQARAHLEDVQRWSHGGPQLERATDLLEELGDAG